MKAPTKGLSLEFHVGTFVLLGFIAIAAFAFRLTESPIFQSGIEVVTYLDDATGLFKLTKVKRAGIPIGFVKNIELSKNRAKVTLVIDKGYELPKNAKVVPRPLGILGDKYIDIVIPGVGEKNDDKEERDDAKGDTTSWIDWLVPSAYAADETIVLPSGVPEAPVTAAPAPSVPVKGKVKAKSDKLRSGDVIKASNAPSSVDDLTKEAADISKDIKASSKTVRKILETNANDIDVLIKSWMRISTKLEKVVNRIDTENLGRDLQDLSNAAGRMGRSLENVETITGKVARGEGTIGKLINDPTTADSLNTSLTYLNHAVERSRRIQTIVDVSGDYLPAIHATKTYVGLRIMTRETSGYIAQVAVDPYGTEKTVITTETVDGGTPKVTETVTNDRSELKYSVQFYKRIGEVVFRPGLFENSGGIGMDLMLFRDRVQLTGEFFEFSRRGDRPHVRAFVRVPFLTYLYAQAGGDELVTRRRTDERRPSMSAGLGIRFTDDDIKTLFLLPGIP